MDYKELVLRGYMDETSRKHLSKYFLRAYKNASKEHYEAEEFFDGCHGVVRQLKSEIQKLLNELKVNLSKGIDKKAERLTAPGTEMSPSAKISYYSTELSLIKTKEELHDLSKEDCTVNLYYFTNNAYQGHIKYSEVLYIQEAIDEAQGQASHKQSKGQRKLPDIALEYAVYNDAGINQHPIKKHDTNITRQNSGKIATTWGYTESTKLYQDFLKFNSATKRKDVHALSRTQYKNKRKMFEKVLKLLQGAEPRKTLRTSLEALDKEWREKCEHEENYTG